jgi:hypothetical protein
MSTSGEKKKKGKTNIKEDNFPNSRFKLLHILLFAFLALIPQYLMRHSEKAYSFFYNYFTTYPGDLWYCWSHYLHAGFPYPREYPAGIQALYRLIFQIKPLWATYEIYFLFISLFLGTFAIGATYLLYRIVQRTHKSTKKIILFWILAPSFLFYGLLNFEFACIFAIMLSYYLFLEEEYYLSACVLSLGTSFKVFPIFLAPVFFFQCPKEYRWGSLLSFVAVWFAFNGPFMLREWNVWSFPYIWQIQSNYATSWKDGSFWWIPYQTLQYLGFSGKIVGKLSLLLFGGMYFYLMKKYWHLSLARKCAIVILLFLLTDRIYSPQYTMYLLPFLVLADYKIDLRYFYLAEIPNMLQVMFLFWMKNNHQIFGHFYGGSPLYLQILVFIKYFALIMLLYQTVKTPVEFDTDRAYSKYLKQRTDNKTLEEAV